MESKREAQCFIHSIKRADSGFFRGHLLAEGTVRFEGHPEKQTFFPIFKALGETVPVGQFLVGQFRSVFASDGLPILRPVLESFQLVIPQAAR